MSTAPRIDPPQSGQTGISNPGTSTGINGGGTLAGVTRTGMTLVPRPLREGVSGPASPQQIAEDMRQVRGLRFDQMWLLTTVLMVVGIVSLLAAVYTYTSKSAFEQAGQHYTNSLQDQAREMGQTLAHSLAQSGRIPMRDNDYQYFKNQVETLVKQNPNVSRVRIFNSDRVAIADSDGDLGQSTDRKFERGSATGIYKNASVFEYQEPIEYGSATGPGLVVLTYSLDRLQGVLTDMESMKQETLSATTTRTAGLGFGFLIAAAGLAFVLSRRITRPLGTLTQSVTRLAEGDFEVRPAAERGASREVKTLGIAFNHMADRISLLMEDVRKKAFLEGEIQVAKTVQETLLPNRDVFPIGPLKIAGTSFAADACGGDWWFRSALGPTRVVVGVGDVTGHGLSTALVATSATSGFASAVMLHDPSQINAKVLANALNLTLFNLARGEFQMSSALAVIDLTSGILEFTSGGHPPAQVFNRHDGKVSSLSQRGAMFGLSEHSDYSSARYQLRPGDVVVWYSDGLTEAGDKDGNQYSLKRLQNALRQYGYLPSNQLRDAIITDVQQHMGGAPQADDVTVVVAEYMPGEAQ